MSKGPSLTPSTPAAQTDTQGVVPDRDGSGSAEEGLVASIKPHYPKGEGRSPAYPLMMKDVARAPDAELRASWPGRVWSAFPTKPPSSTSAACWKKHELAGGVQAVINGYLGDRGLSLRQGTIVDATLFMRRVRPRTRTAIRKCTRSRNATNATSACRRISA